MTQTWPVTLTDGGSPAVPSATVRLDSSVPWWAQSHIVEVRVDLLSAGVVIRTLSSVLDGNVTLDQTAATRGRVELTIVDPELVPDSHTDALMPYGNELQVYRGTPGLLTSLGIFRIDEANVTDAPDALTIAVTGMDRSVRLIDAKFEEPYIISAGTNVVTAIETMVEAADPTIVVNLEPTSAVMPLITYDEGGDRWKALQDMATSIGRSLYFDGDGELTGQPVSSGANPVAAISEGAGGTLLSAGRRLARQGAHNRYIVTGENAAEGSAPSRGVATDNNPLSPTYYFGPFGKVPAFVTSQLVTTDQQAQDMAQGLLSRELGVTDQINFGALVNPALKPDDVVTVTRERLGVNEDHIIDSLVIPLAATGAMTGQTRASQVL